MNPADPPPASPPEPPATPGVGELWVAVQGIDVPGKPVDTGSSKLSYPDLLASADDFVCAHSRTVCSGRFVR